MARNYEHWPYAASIAWGIWRTKSAFLRAWVDADNPDGISAKSMRAADDLAALFPDEGRMLVTLDEVETGLRTALGAGSVSATGIDARDREQGHVPIPASFWPQAKVPNAPGVLDGFVSQKADGSWTPFYGILLGYRGVKQLFPPPVDISTLKVPGPLRRFFCEYPNHSLGQVQDWMNDIYPMWVKADGIFIVSPVNWYQVSSPLKLMMDRLVCADGGNPDPTLTHGKDAETAKAIELDHWDYPRHLAGRLYAVVSHGDVEGAENVRRSISDWLRFMRLEPAGPKAEVDRYIGYWKPYAISHDELDADIGMQGEVRNAAAALLEAVKAKREGRWVTPGASLHEPRQK